RVLGSEYDGAFAQYCVVPAAQLYDVSAAPLSDVELAALPCAHGTAFNLLSRADVGSHDRVLVTGASGGVGLAAVELAKLAGAHVTALASAGKAGAVKAAGADIVLDRNDTPEPGSFTVAIDVVGGDRWPGVIDALEAGGRYAVSGAIAGPIVEADLRTIYLNDLTLFGCTYTSREVFAELVAMIAAGQVNPLVSNTYPLADIHIAQTDFIAKKYPGKLVLIPPRD
ncbi:MAG: zinc-binding dehydrogenase, partial [Rhodospirillaceae bacterium]|nr:zinc-binding dehydrogenase [Rhodospirillaceae bacterium]